MHNIYKTLCIGGNVYADDITTKKIIGGHKIKDITKGVYTSISLDKMHQEISKINP